MWIKAGPASALTTLLLLIIVLLLCGKGRGCLVQTVNNCCELHVCSSSSLLLQRLSCPTQWWLIDWILTDLWMAQLLLALVADETTFVDGFSLAGHQYCGSVLCLYWRNILAKFSWGRMGCFAACQMGQGVCCLVYGAHVFLSQMITTMLTIMTVTVVISMIKCAAHFLANLNKLCVCVAERTRRHRHTACQQTGRERTDPEETNRPEPRVQEEHTRGEKIRYSRTRTNTQPRIYPAILLTLTVCLCVSLCLFSSS